MASIAPSTASAPASTAAQDAGCRDAAGVMGMKMQRQTHFFFERLDQRGRSARLTQAAHVLDGEHLRPHGFQFLGQADVILQVILGLARIGQIAGVTNRRLAQSAGLAYGFDRHLHVLDPVEAIEDAKQRRRRRRWHWR